MVREHMKRLIAIVMGMVVAVGTSFAYPACLDSHTITINNFWMTHWDSDDDWYDDNVDFYPSNTSRYYTIELQLNNIYVVYKNQNVKGSYNVTGGGFHTTATHKKGQFQYHLRATATYNDVPQEYSWSDSSKMYCQ